MFVRRYAFEKGQSKNLEISWKYDWKLEKIFTIRLDGEEINPIENQYNRRNGWEFLLQDGSRLKVKLSRFFRQLEVYRNGEPLPGSATDPSYQLAEVYKFILAWSAMLIASGILKMVLRGNNSAKPGYGLDLIAVGVFLLILGFLVRSKSLAALITVIATFILLGLQSDYHLISTWSFRPFFDTFFGLIMALFLIPGIRAIKKLKKAPSFKFTHN